MQANDVATRTHQHPIELLAMYLDSKRRCSRHPLEDLARDPQLVLVDALTDLLANLREAAAIEECPPFGIFTLVRVPN